MSGGARPTDYFPLEGKMEVARTFKTKSRIAAAFYLPT
jgi:hypothetical protein